MDTLRTLGEIALLVGALVLWGAVAVGAMLADHPACKKGGR